VVTFRRTVGHGEDYTLKGNDRQIGKVLELAFQYGGGVGAILSACDTYRVDPKVLAKAAWAVASKTTQRQARRNYDFAKERHDPLVRHLSEKLWCMLESAKIMWRDSSPQTTSLWKNYEEAAKAAVRSPGKAFKAGRCVFQVRAGMLAVRLPSGRLLIYLKPEIRKRDGKRPELRYVSPYGLPEKLYGGKIAENITQAAARDVLGYAMVNVDEEGFAIVLHVHDEIVAEQDIGEPRLTYDLLKEIMCKKPAWAGGLPLTAEGFVATRYRKD
jgi:DNA polymerase